MRKISPKITIGIPVYNGENFLREAIECFLAQTYQNFELILCDNASTDRTASICEEYVNKDSRIRYHRNPANIGVSLNLNRVFELAEGDYFKWAAHDDLVTPEYLETCLSLMEADPEIVVCQSQIQVIDKENNPIYSGIDINDDVIVTSLNRNDSLTTDSPLPHRRFHALTVDSTDWLQVYGLIRCEALRQTELFKGLPGDDMMLLCQLSLLGRFHTIQQPMFFNRRHHGQSISTGIRSTHQFAILLNPAKYGKLIFPQWELLYSFFTTVRDSPHGVAEKIRLYGCVANFFLKYSDRLWKDIAVGAIQVCELLWRTIFAQRGEESLLQQHIFNRFPRLIL